MGGEEVDTVVVAIPKVKAEEMVRNNTKEATMAIKGHQHPVDLHKATAPIVEGVHHVEEVRHVEVATAITTATATATATAPAEVHPQPATRTGILLRKALPTLKAILLRKATPPAIHQLLARAPSVAEVHSEDILTANLAHHHNHHREEATRPLHDQVLGTDSRY